MNNELLSLTLALAMLEDVQTHNNGCHISFNVETKTIYTTSGLFVQKIAAATGEEIRVTESSYEHPATGELCELTYYEVPVKGWTLQTLINPDEATR